MSEGLGEAGRDISSCLILRIRDMVAAGLGNMSSHVVGVVPVAVEGQVNRSASLLCVYRSGESREPCRVASYRGCIRRICRHRSMCGM